MNDLDDIEGMVLHGLEGVEDVQKRKDYIVEAKAVLRRYRLLFDGKLQSEDGDTIREYGDVCGFTIKALLILSYLKERCDRPIY